MGELNKNSEEQLDENSQIQNLEKEIAALDQDIQNVQDNFETFPESLIKERGRLREILKSLSGKK